MRPILIALLTALCFVPVHAAEQMEAPKDMVVLTVSGDIRNINRGALDSGKDSLLAPAKSRLSARLCLRPSHVASPQAGGGQGATPELKHPATLAGPLLKEVLAGVGAARAKVSFLAVDGYQGWLAPEDIDTSDGILAFAMDGSPLGGWTARAALADQHAGGREKPSDDDRDHWVWALFYMRVGE